MDLSSRSGLFAFPANRYITATRPVIQISQILTYDSQEEEIKGWSPFSLTDLRILMETFPTDLPMLMSSIWKVLRMKINNRHFQTISGCRLLSHLLPILPQRRKTQKIQKARKIKLTWTTTAFTDEVIVDIESPDKLQTKYYGNCCFEIKYKKNPQLVFKCF